MALTTLLQLYWSLWTILRDKRCPNTSSYWWFNFNFKDYMHGVLYEKWDSKSVNTNYFRMNIVQRWLLISKQNNLIFICIWYHWYILRIFSSVARLRDLSPIPRFWRVSWRQDFCKNRMRFLREIPRFWRISYFWRISRDFWAKCGQFRRFWDIFLALENQIFFIISIQISKFQNK